MVLWFDDPLLFAVILKFEYGWRDDSVYDCRVYIFRVLDVALQLDVHQHSQKEEVFIEVELVFHITDLSEDLVDH